MTVDPIGPATPAPRTAGAVTRARLVVVALVVGCVGLLVLALTGQAPASTGLRFAQIGHWAYSGVFQSAFHVDGSTNQVDARVKVPGAEAGSQVVQGDQSGYVVGRTRITEFSKSTLSVEGSQTPPATERPVVLEAAGGPYLVYRNAGQVVRLGDPTAVVPAGGPLTAPAVTSGGSVWLHRVDSGALCELPSGATRLACPAQMAQGHSGSLTVVDDQPVLVDTTSDTLQVFGKEGFGRSVPLGVDLPANAQVANATIDGRLAVVDPDRNRLHLIDTAGLQGRPVVKPVAVDLPKGGRFAGPVTTSHVIAVVDQAHNDLLTYDSGGTARASAKVPGTDGTAEPVRGEDNRVYVDSADGSHVLIVNGDSGTVGSVSVADPTPPASPSALAAAPGTAATPVVPTPGAEQPDASTPGATSPRPPPAQRPATVPGSPGNVSAAAGDRSATVSWSPAAANGGQVTAYLLSWSGGSTRVGGSSTRTTVTGLNNGASYTITVVAENSAGRGSGASASVQTPTPAAGAPSVTAQVPDVWFGIRGVTVTWTRPDLAGGTLVYYVVSVTGQPDQQVTTERVDYDNIMSAGTATVYAVTRFGSGPTLVGRSASASFKSATG